MYIEKNLQIKDLYVTDCTCTPSHHMKFVLITQAVMGHFYNWTLAAKKTRAGLSFYISRFLLLPMPPLRRLLLT